MSYREKITKTIHKIPVCDFRGVEGPSEVEWHTWQKTFNWVEKCRFCGKDTCPQCRGEKRVNLCLKCDEKLTKKIQQEKEQAIKDHWY